MELEFCYNPNCGAASRGMDPDVPNVTTILDAPSVEEAVKMVYGEVFGLDGEALEYATEGDYTPEYLIQFGDDQDASGGDSILFWVNIDGNLYESSVWEESDFEYEDDGIIIAESVKRVLEGAENDSSKIHVGIFHEDANEMVILDNEDLEDKMDYTDSCEKDPNNTYVVWCDDESVSIYPYSEYKKYIDDAVKTAEEQLKEATEDDPYIEVYDIPYIGVYADSAEDYERVEKFLEDPEAYVREAINESFTDMDSSSGGAIFTLSEDGRIKEIANGDLSLYWGFDDEDSDDE